MSEISILAIDLAKNRFQVCDVRSDGVFVFNRAASRARLIQFLADQPPCAVAMEACATSHYWGRVVKAKHEDQHRQNIDAETDSESGPDVVRDVMVYYPG